MARRQRTWARAALLTLAVLAVAALAGPAGAAAHGLSGRADLPVPTWLFAWAAAVVLVGSFLAIAALWRTPRLERAPERELARLPAPLEWAAGALGVALFALVVVSGLAGTQVPLDNLAPTAIYVAFWVGIPLASVVLGDVFHPLNPWRALARAAGALWRPTSRAPAWRVRPYPERLGRWPAVAGIVAFAWVELVYVDRDVPAQLAMLALAYAGVQLVGMAIFGVAAWTARGDAFAVVFSLFGRLAPLGVRGGLLVARRPLAGLTGLPPLPGTVALMVVLIGATTFDGALNGALWGELAPPLRDGFGALGASPQVARHLADTVGVAGSIAVVAGLFALGVGGMRGVGRTPPPKLATRFAHTLVPIALAYSLAHYFSLLVFQGQALPGLLADPLGHDGANGEGSGIDYGLISATGIWYVQVGALVVGHVAGLLLAHDRSLVTFTRVEVAVRSQYWMLAMMVGYTGLGLWLLSAVST